MRYLMVLMLLFVTGCWSGQSGQDRSGKTSKSVGGKDTSEPAVVGRDKVVRMVMTEPGRKPEVKEITVHEEAVTFVPDGTTEVERDVKGKKVLCIFGWDYQQQHVGTCSTQVHQRWQQAAESGQYDEVIEQW